MQSREKFDRTQRALVKVILVFFHNWLSNNRKLIMKTKKTKSPIEIIALVLPHQVEWPIEERIANREKHTSVQWGQQRLSWRRKNKDFLLIHISLGRVFDHLLRKSIVARTHLPVVTSQGAHFDLRITKDHPRLNLPPSIFATEKRIPFAEHVQHQCT